MTPNDVFFFFSFSSRTFVELSRREKRGPTFECSSTDEHVAARALESIKLYANEMALARTSARAISRGDKPNRPLLVVVVSSTVHSFEMMGRVLLVLYYLQGRRDEETYVADDGDSHWTVEVESSCCVG